MPFIAESELIPIDSNKYYNVMILKVSSSTIRIGELL